MSIRRVVAMETVTLTDLTDAIISGTEPDVKTDGMLWIDGDNILKQWNGVSWDKVELDVSSLDPDLSETITTILGKVGSIADDGVLDFEDRKVINEEVALVIGDYPSTTLTSYTALPDYNDFDSNPRGSFGRVRETTRSVVGAKKAISLPEYVALASAFQKLGDLLIKTRPVRMWDITTLNKDVVITLSDYGLTPDDLRTGLLNYYMAELTLSEYNNQKAVDVSKEYTDENIKDTVKEMVHMYAYSDSMTEPPQEGVPWVYKPLSPEDDRYIWMRTRVIYKNGDESTSDPYLSSFDITATLGDLDQKTNNPAFSDRGLEGGGVEVEFGGGRNLLRNTSENWTEIVRPEGNYFYEKGTDYQVEVGETYTFSIIVEKVSDDTVPITLALGLGATAGGYNWDFPTWSFYHIPFGEKISLTYTIKESDVDGGARTYFAWRLRNERLATTIRFKEVKLEKGTTATPYTPAPEDGTHELDIVSSVGGRNLLIQSEFLQNQVVQTDSGELMSANRGNVIKDFIPSKNNNFVTVSRKNETSNEYGTEYLDHFKVSAYNESFEFISAQDSGNGSMETILPPKTYAIPEGTSYLLFSSSRGDLYNLKVEFGNKATDWTPAPEDIPYDTLVDGVYKTKAEFPSDEAYSLPSLPKSNYVYSVGDFEPQLNTRWKSPGWKRVNTMQDDMVIMGNNIDTTMEGTRQMIYQLRDGVKADGSEYNLTKFHNIVNTVDYHNRTISGENDVLATTVMTNDMFSRTIGTAVSRLEYPNNVDNTGTGVARNSHTFSLAPGMNLSKGMTLQFKTSLYPKSYRVTILKDDDTQSIYSINVTSGDHASQSLSSTHVGGAKTLTIALYGDTSTTFILNDVQLTEKQPEDIFPLPFHDSWENGNFSRTIQLENMISNEVVFGGKVVSAINTNLEGVSIKGKEVTFDADVVKISNLVVDSLQIADFSISTSKLQDDAVTGGKLAQLAVGTANIANGAITTAKIGNAQITTAKIGDAQITTAKIGDAQITSAKIKSLSVDKLDGNTSSFVTSKWNDGVSSVTANASGLTVTQSNGWTQRLNSGGHQVYDNNGNFRGIFGGVKNTSANNNNLFIGATDIGGGGLAVGYKPNGTAANQWYTSFTVDGDDGDINFLRPIKFTGGSSSIISTSAGYLNIDARTQLNLQIRGSTKIRMAYGSDIQVLDAININGYNINNPYGVYFNSGGSIYTLTDGTTRIDVDSSYYLQFRVGTVQKMRIDSTRIYMYQRLNMQGNQISESPSVSDARLKDVQRHRSDNDLEKLMNIKYVDFIWKEDGKADFGFIAQQIQGFVPEIIRDVSGGGLG